MTLNEAAGRPEMRGQNIKCRPFAFTEQGVAMLSSVLKSKRAAIRELMTPPQPAPKRRIGFISSD